MTYIDCDGINNLVLIRVGAMEDIIKLIQANDWAGIQSLINERKFNVNQQDQEGNTALIHAVNLNNITIIENLITAGSYINIKNAQGRTALMVGGVNNHPEIVKILIENGDAKLDEVDQSGYTALMWAVENNNLEIVQLLYTKRASVLIKNNDCKTAKDLVGGETDLYIKECLSKRVIGIEMAMTFLTDLLDNNPHLEEKISADDLATLSLFTEMNEIDFIMAAHSKNIWNPIDIWNNIQNIDRIELSAHDSRCCRTDSEGTDGSYDFHTIRVHNNSPEVLVMGVGFYEI